MKGAPGGKIRLRDWREEIERQAFGLITGRIAHPSIPTTSANHRAYLVTNGELEEEVIRAIEDMNRSFAAQGRPDCQLRTIVRGELLRRARELETNLWPTDLADIKELIEMYLEGGDGPLPKPKLARLIERVILQTTEEQTPGKDKLGRSLASAAVLCALALASFSLRSNFWAQIEAWTLYAGYVLGLAERYGLAKHIWLPHFDIAERELYSLLVRLSAELRERSHYVEGSPMADGLVYGYRMTVLVGLLSVLALWPRQQEGDERDCKFIREFCQRHTSEMKIWGEGSLACLVALFWQTRLHDATLGPDLLLRNLVAQVSQANAPRSNNALPSPYYEPTDVLPHALGIAEVPIRETFAGRSYSLEGLVHLFARRIWRQQLRFLWPDISRVRFVRFYPPQPADFFRWRCAQGITRDVEPHHTQSWGELLEEVQESKGACVPALAREFPVFVLLYMLVCPHRMNSEVLRWLDQQIAR
ncbi:MAG TPA: hypothetical protein VMT86_13750 [Bryobacteraceae bacterium]|nr:hypothetical protein [Bryobacteraceae bacterium]